MTQVYMQARRDLHGLVATQRIPKCTTGDSDGLVGSLVSHREHRADNLGSKPEILVPRVRSRRIRISLLSHAITVHRQVDCDGPGLVLLFESWDRHMQRVDLLVAQIFSKLLVQVPLAYYPLFQYSFEMLEPRFG
ncbi:hypothetical protein RRF57_010497 [Xylaria bambusicola]|uniref:Uncharacterized protein n=1 Tax=Xylaria bambusicola TaxID=326684 RepID=A0AAN7V1H8_9PEZI